MLVCVTWSASAPALLKIEITDGVEGAAPIAVVPFGWEESDPPPEDVAAIIAADLARSGLFSPVAREDLVARPTDAADIKFFNWKSIGADNLVIGRLRSVGGDNYVVQFQLFDVYKERQIVGYSFPVERQRLRQVAHKISDLVYEKITGQRGAFNTLVAYVSAVDGEDGKRRYELQVADSDGHNPRTVLFSNQPLMSPSWSPDAKHLAYVSFENKRSHVFMQELATGERTALSELEGINGSPVWSPDGRYLALTLSHAGNPDIYLLDLRSRRLRELTRNPAIDTEPSFTPDGETVVFTSDRSGSAQVYEIPVRGGRAKRVTFEGSYNASPVVSPDGRYIAMVTSDRGNYRIGILDRNNRALRVLSDGRLDESPSFAPNGSMLLFATEGEGRGELGAVSADGRMRQRLSLSEGDVREPVWSPFLSKQ